MRSERRGRPAPFQQPGLACGCEAAVLGCPPPAPLLRNRRAASGGERGRAAGRCQPGHAVLGAAPLPPPPPRLGPGPGLRWVRRGAGLVAVVSGGAALEGVARPAPQCAPSPRRASGPGGGGSLWGDGPSVRGPGGGRRGVAGPCLVARLLKQTGRVPEPQRRGRQRGDRGRREFALSSPRLCLAL